MTVRLDTFERQLDVIHRLGCTVVPLAELVAWRLGQRTELPQRAVALTVDDGHRSQFEFMAPALRERGWPITLFIYPSVISNASYAMTWEQLRSLRDIDGIDIQSHTFWHPNFIVERRRMAPPEFERFAADQLTRSKAVLQSRLGGEVSLLAWPFGLTDDGLNALAARAGYKAAFVLGQRPVVPDAPAYALPRFLAAEALQPSQLERMLRSSWRAPVP